MDMKKATIAVIGLGYVGLPLAVEFGNKRKVIGFDINDSRISELNSGIDSTLEVEPELLAEATRLSFTSDTKSLKEASIYIAGSTPEIANVVDKLYQEIIVAGTHKALINRIPIDILRKIC